MTDKLEEAKTLLLHKQFLRKGNSGFINSVTHVAFDELKKEIRVSYDTINHNKHTASSMELSEFIGMHVIQ